MWCQRGDGRGSVGRRRQRVGRTPGLAGAAEAFPEMGSQTCIKFSLLTSLVRSIGNISFFYTPLPKLNCFSHPPFLLPPHLSSGSVLSFGILCSYHIFPFLHPFSNSPVILSLSASRLPPLPCTMLSFWNYSHQPPSAGAPSASSHRRQLGVVGAALAAGGGGSL